MATVANQRHGMPSSGTGELDLIADSIFNRTKDPQNGPNITLFMKPTTFYIVL